LNGNSWLHVTLECPAARARPKSVGKGERKGDGQDQIHGESEL